MIAGHAASDVREEGDTDDEDDSMRATLERISTDAVWRCPNRDVAGLWAQAGGDVWLGEWVEGFTYPDNEGSYCQGEGVVCHQVRSMCDDRL